MESIKVPIISVTVLERTAFQLSPDNIRAMIDAGEQIHVRVKISDLLSQVGGRPVFFMEVIVWSTVRNVDSKCHYGIHKWRIS